MSMTVDDAQAEMREAYVRGGPGAVVSALVWFAAAFALNRSDHATAFAVLFLGGMLIFPLGSLVEKYVFHRAASTPGNPLTLLALESTIAMIGCLLAAWLLLRHNPEAVFPVAAIAVGTHYLPFKTAYGDRTYWVLGGLVTAIGLGGLFWLPGQTMTVILAVAVAELVFGIHLTRQGISSGMEASSAG